MRKVLIVPAFVQRLLESKSKVSSSPRVLKASLADMASHIPAYHS